MTRYPLAIGMLCLLSVSAARAATNALPEEVDVAVREVFAPQGFDDNDEITLVIDGFLPDPCHQLIRPHVAIDEQGRSITVGARARRYKGACPDVIVPYTQEIHLGRLSAGDFRVASKDGALHNALVVKRSTNPGPDDYLYAPIDNARVEYPSPSRWIAVLEGRFTSPCLAIDETRVLVTGKTIQVLPIMRVMTQEEAGEPCRVTEEIPFRVEAEIPYLPTDGRYLLHVRSLNGQAVNEVFTRTRSHP